MKGWLVVNGFLKSEKFEQLYEFFQNSAEKLDIELDVVKSDSLCDLVDADVDQKPDFVLFWDKDIHLARRLERCGLRLFNSVAAVEACDSKILLAEKLTGVVPVPLTVVAPKTFADVGYTDTSFLQKAALRIGLPMVVKEEFGSFGQQVYLARTLCEAKTIAERLAKEGKSFVLQRYIAESCGKDIRVNVVGGKAVNAILRSSQSDFRSNITLGGTMSEHHLTEAEALVAETAARALGLDFCGVDILFGTKGPLLCEVNSNPHFKSTFEATGVDLSEHILQHISNTICEGSK